MIHYLFLGATWLVGVAGIGGALAIAAGCIFLGPAAVQAIVQPLLVRFLACRACELALATLLALLAAYWIGHHTAAAECKADALAQELAIKQADVDNANKAKDDAINRSAQIESKASGQHDKDLEYISALKKRPACALDSGDVGGLRVHGFRIPLPAGSAK
jgi:hypothetical protein